MDAEELNETIRRLVESADNMQQFADLASPDENWALIDKNIPMPRHTGFTEAECPACLDYVRLIYEKYSTKNYELPFTCPICKAPLRCRIEYTGYTSEVYLEEE